MVKKLALILIVFLVGCTTYQAKRLEQILGVFRMLGFFEVDINSTEKQTFVIDNPRKQSFWGRTLDGQTHWVVDLCFDREKKKENDGDLDTMMQSPEYFEAPIWVSMTMGGVHYYEKMRLSHRHSTSCWWLDERSGIHRLGWSIAGGFFPVDAEFTSPMIVEVQFLDSKNSELKKIAEKYSNPHLMVSTGY